MKTDDSEGVLKLSKKLVDAFQGWEEIVKAKENDEILEGVVSAVVKGGVVAVTNGSRVFIPASQTGVPRNQELDVLKGTTVRFRIIDINPARRRAVGSIKVVANEERKAQQDALWATLEEGQKLTGTVKSLTSYGAFVDIGGMDGMIHISELSWNRIKHPSEVVNVGDIGAAVSSFASFFNALRISSSVRSFSFFALIFSDILSCSASRLSGQM